MDLDRLTQVLEICVPVFGLIGLGIFLHARRLMNDDHLTFVNNLIYNVSLPALIFLGVSTQHFDRLLHPAVLTGTLGATALILAAFVVLARLLRLPGILCAPFVYGAFFANVSYMGFPLAGGAFGEIEGIANAGVVNAFAMPTFIALCYLLIHLWVADHQDGGWRRLARAMLNPIIGAALIGILAAMALDVTGLRQTLANNAPSASLIATAKAFLRLLGQMGLPLALIAVGGALRWQSVTRHPIALSLTILAKLVLTPLVTWAIIHYGFPDTELAARGTAVLLMATPASVSSYVISKRLNVSPDFMAAHLVISTALSVLTIPAWLYLLL